ncbi:hydrogenase expression/formation protein [Candidatus Thiothrix sp. Deng01]|uniref:Hydrogenase expression/formation protein n=1 Tax=Candidatus Thiothrix phosphatis TaxID=3112415 RepID=A0ABU6CTV6_9GAMM|nr:hydrogenase expression/formation protein [Candidatus Thiothrix sp. Deng01]MEB4590265.1 hydrogenase expression/formation protein [Candidatus Thiothrix sp. Deng01]
MSTMHLLGIPVIGVGSQPAESEALDYLPMPKDMHVYHQAVLPENEDLQAHPHVLTLLQQLQDLLDRRVAGGAGTERFLPLEGVNAADKKLLAQILAEGEVSVLFDTGDGGHIEIQECSLPGVWWHRTLDADKTCHRETLEIGMIPQLVRESTFDDALPDVPLAKASSLPETVINAPWLLAELQEQVQKQNFGHVINLTLLPLTEDDLSLLSQQLGVGKVAILSRGYGNCRVTASNVEDVWWVQYFNSTDTLILNTLEVVEVPLVACASPEDLEDSAGRLREIREALQ